MWISIPVEFWHEEWHGKYTNPVVKLVLKLYGIKTAGEICHTDSKKRILCQGWEEFGADDWADMYYHPKYHAC